MRGVKASISAVGAAYAEMEELQPKHGIKQFDRFLSNEGIDVAALTPGWARFVLGGRSDVLVALDWTEFDDDDHATICAYVVTTHGRATPLIWRTVKKSDLEGKRTGYEHALIERLHDAIPHNIGVDLLADRGFGDQVLYTTLATLGWDYTIRFRGNILVEHDGKQRPAVEWLLPTGRARKLEGARVVALHAPRQSSLQIGWQCAGVPRGLFRARPQERRAGNGWAARQRRERLFGSGLPGKQMANVSRRRESASREASREASGRSRAEAPAGGRAIDDVVVFERGERLAEVQVLDAELAAQRDTGDGGRGGAKQAEETIRE
jgi:hypothetical protein